MAGISDPAFNRGDPFRRLEELERRIRAVETAHTLENSSISQGDFRLIGGSITVDPGGNIIIKGGRLLAGDPAGERAEVSPTGYRLINVDGEIVIDLTTDGVNQLLLRGGQQEDSEILLSAEGVINCRQLNAEQIFLAGDPINPETTTSGPTNPGPNSETYPCEWSQAYLGSGSPNTFDPTPRQGFYDSTNGNQRSLFGFDSAQIQADLASAISVDSVRVFLYYNHWYFNAGGTAIIGYHGHSDAPQAFSADTDEIRVPDWPKPGGRWVELSTSGWASGSRKGVAIGPGPSTNRVYYGRAHGVNQSNPPKLEITWTN